MPSGVGLVEPAVDGPGGYSAEPPLRLRPELKVFDDRFRLPWRPVTEEVRTLYRRLGGYDVIARVVDDLFLALRGDPAFARFATRSIDSHNRARQLLVGQICELSSGPCVYIGRDMQTSHAGLEISDSEWTANMRHAEAALVKYDVPASERAEFLGLFERYRAEIVKSD